MATLIKNDNAIIPECDSANKGTIDQRIEVQNASLGDIRAEITDLHNTISASPDEKIKTIKKATSFPVAEILQMIQDHSDCEYLRVYNGFDSNGNFVTYLAAINPDFETYVVEDPTNFSKVIMSCCHCNPCTKDNILNSLP